jgi:HK97 family phage major capsid protein
MSYLERMNAEFEEVTRGIQARIDTAERENRDLTDAEDASNRADDTRRQVLERGIKEHTVMAERTVSVAVLRGRINTGQDSSSAGPEEFDLLKAAPTPGHWASIVHRGRIKGDRAALEIIERATAHQLLADNPGIVPKPIVAPVVDTLRTMRPLVQSIAERPDAPAGKFDRPVVNQHVAVAPQDAEKTETASQVMKIDPVEIVLATHAGHVNISRQDIRWTQPGILDLIYGDFAKVYARVSDKAACATFVAEVTATQELPNAAGTPAGASDIDDALGTAGGTIEGLDGDEAELNHLWLSRDIAVALAKLRNPTTGTKLYNIPLVNGTTGDLDGLPVTIDKRFTAGTAIAGDDSLVEFWEDLEGFLQVDEPNVLGTMVGYAGYNALKVLVPAAFVKFTNAAAFLTGATSSRKR